MRVKTARIVIDRRTGQVESSSLPLDELGDRVVDYIVDLYIAKIKAEQEERQRLALIEHERRMENFYKEIEELENGN